MRYAWDKRRDPILGIAGILGGIGGIPPGMRRQVTPPIYQKSQVGMTGSHLGCFIIPGGIPGGIPPGTDLGSQVGMAGSRLGLRMGSHLGQTWDPGWDWRDPATQFYLGKVACWLLADNELISI